MPPWFARLRWCERLHHLSLRALPLVADNVSDGLWVRVRADAALVQRLCEPGDDVGPAPNGTSRSYVGWNDKMRDTLGNCFQVVGAVDAYSWGAVSHAQPHVWLVDSSLHLRRSGGWPPRRSRLGVHLASLRRRARVPFPLHWRLVLSAGGTGARLRQRCTTNYHGWKGTAVVCHAASCRHSRTALTRALPPLLAVASSPPISVEHSPAYAADSHCSCA